MQAVELLIGLGTMAVLASCFSTPATHILQNSANEPAPPTQRPSDTYLGLRKLALDTSAAEIGMSVAPGSKEPYGILMEFCPSPEHVVTLTSFASGDASIYFSSGGGVIGGIEHDSVSRAAKSFVSLAQTYVDKMAIVSSYPLPDGGKVKFYVLTPQGTMAVEDNEEDLVQGKSDLSPLFYAGNNVITEIRLVTEKHYK